jgi:transcriptional regulator with XRE-family HTH domain
MMGLNVEAFRAPPVLLSAASASSAGQSLECRSWERRPFEMPTSLARSVSDMASGRLRYASSVMPERLDHLNHLWQPKSLGYQNDDGGSRWYSAGMPAPRHDWYLKQWLRTLGKRQADIVRDLDWNKARVSLMLRGEQPYTRDAVNELADYLNLRPYELLMHPDDAMAIRRLRADMIRLAHETVMPVEDESEPEKVSLG